MVGDTLKKASDSPDGGLVEIKDYGDARSGFSFFLSFFLETRINRCFSFHLIHIFSNY